MERALTNPPIVARSTAHSYMCVVVVVSRIESMRMVVSVVTGAGATTGGGVVVSWTGAASVSSSLFAQAVVESAALRANPASNKLFIPSSTPRW